MWGIDEYWLRDWLCDYRFVFGPGRESGVEELVFSNPLSARHFLQALCSSDNRNLGMLRRMAGDRWGLFSLSDCDNDTLLTRLANDLAYGGYRVLKRRRPTIYLSGRKKKQRDEGGGAAEQRHFFAVKVVDDASGAPMAGCRLEVVFCNGSRRPLVTGSDGVARVADAPDGHHELSSPFGGITLSKIVSIADGAGTGSKDKKKKTSGKTTRAGKQGEAEVTYSIARVKAHRVKKGETLDKIAQANGLTPAQLAYFNFGVYERDEVEIALRDQLGSTERTEDGRYVFDDADEPGVLFIPSPWKKERLPSDQQHLLRVKKVERQLPDLCFWYQLDPHEPNAKNDTLTLETEDQSWSHELQVASLSEVHPGWVELSFPEPPSGSRFNLIQDPKDGEDPFYIFYELSYGELREAQAELEEEERAKST